jgi:N-acyl-D-amino-acid deacylase
MLIPPSGCPFRSTIARLCVSATLLVSASPLPAQSSAGTFDIIIRGGTVVDGTGAPPYRADVGITRGHIARVGDLARATARTEIDASGLFVAPGFINIHSHAEASQLSSGANMLTQGVTTELLNADGFGPTDIGAQLDAIAKNGLALNIAASAPFNAAWTEVMGLTDHRPTPDETARMRAIVLANLERGAFGVSAGLDYKPAYFASTEEAIAVLSVARPWRTFFPNHDRLSPETGFSSRKGMDETVTIGTGAGLVPVFTHMKLQGHEQGMSADVLAMMRRETAAGRWVAADVYPYLAGQTMLAALIIPGWAQEGGIEKMRERFADTAMRRRIITEADQAITARFNGAASILLNESGRTLAGIMQAQGLASPGEAVVKVLETEYPQAILTFGAEADLRKILAYPSAVVACDCGASNQARGHPRAYGTFPRVLGHYVRETGTLTWEDAIRKMTALPAALIGLVDRGMIATGMAADLTLFDTVTVIDRATYAEPTLSSLGIRTVLVNGVVQLRDGVATGQRGGVALRRGRQMPSRQLRLDRVRTVSASGRIESGDSTLATDVVIEVRHGTNSRIATGIIRLTTRSGAVLQSTALGVLQPGPGWATVSGMMRVGTDDRAFTLIIDSANPLRDGSPSMVALQIEGMPPITGVMRGRMTISK